MSTRTRNQDMVRLLEALAEQGEPSRRTEREALALILGCVSRMEAQQSDFLNRCDVLLSQAKGKR